MPQIESVLIGAVDRLPESFKARISDAVFSRVGADYERYGRNWPEQTIRWAPVLLGAFDHMNEPAQAKFVARLTHDSAAAQYAVYIMSLQNRPDEDPDPENRAHILGAFLHDAAIAHLKKSLKDESGPRAEYYLHSLPVAAAALHAQSLIEQHSQLPKPIDMRSPDRIRDVVIEEFVHFATEIESDTTLNESDTTIKALLHEFFGDSSLVENMFVSGYRERTTEHALMSSEVADTTNDQLLIKAFDQFRFHMFEPPHVAYQKTLATYTLYMMLRELAHRFMEHQLDVPDVQRQFFTRAKAYIPGAYQRLMGLYCDPSAKTTP